MANYGSIGYEGAAIGADEIIGYEDDEMDLDQALADYISGEDDDIIGAVKRGKAARVAQLMGQLRKIDPKAVYVKQRRPTARRRLVMGIPRVSVPASGSLEIEIKPQRKIRVERVSCPSSDASNFQFLDIKVGQASQFAAAGAIPCECFTEVARDAYVHFDTANPGYIMTFLVENLDTVNPQTFSAALFGTALV